MPGVRLIRIPTGARTQLIFIGGNKSIRKSEVGPATPYDMRRAIASAKYSMKRGVPSCGKLCNMFRL